MRSASTFVLSSLTVVMSMWPLHAQAQQTATVDARAEVATALYAASATQAAVERQANAKLRAAQAEIARLRGMGLEARSALIAAQERYVAELASRDRAYAEEIAVFRAALEEITSTRDGAAALARFNAGDEIGALDQLDEIVNARDTARRVRGDIETAAERRRVAALARDARSRGQIDTDAVIRRYVEITQLDPNVSDDWKQLSILHVDVGNLQEATRAAVRARETARSNDEIRVALWVLGYAQIKQGKFAAVQSAAEEALRVISGSRLDATRPDYSKLTLVEQQNLASIYDLLAEALRYQGKLGEARVAAQRSVDLLKLVLDAAPENFSIAIDFVIASERLGSLMFYLNRHDEADSTRANNLKVLYRLLKDDPSSVRLQRMIALNLSSAAAILYSKGRYIEARTLYSEGLVAFQALSESDPRAAKPKEDVALSLLMLGLIERELGNFKGCEDQLTGAMTIARNLQSEKNYLSPTTARILARSMHALAGLPQSKTAWIDVATQLDELRGKELLDDLELSFLFEARVRATLLSKYETPVAPPSGLVDLGGIPYAAQVGAIQRMATQGLLKPSAATGRAQESLRDLPVGFSTTSRSQPTEDAQVLEAHWLWWLAEPLVVNFFIQNATERPVTSLLVRVAVSCDAVNRDDGLYVFSLSRALASGEIGFFVVETVHPPANARDAWCMTIIDSF